MIGPPKRNGPESATNTQPGHDRSDFVSTQDQAKQYRETRDLSKARCADCAFLHPYENGGGECRALPPRIADIGWPIVSDAEWCGAFVRRAGA